MAKLGVNPIIVLAATEIMRELSEKLDDFQKDMLAELNDLENNKINVRNASYGKSFLDELKKGDQDVI